MSPKYSVYKNWEILTKLQIAFHHQYVFEKVSIVSRFFLVYSTHYYYHYITKRINIIFEYLYTYKKDIIR